MRILIPLATALLLAAIAAPAPRAAGVPRMTNTPGPTETATPTPEPPRALPTLAAYHGPIPLAAEPPAPPTFEWVGEGVGRVTYAGGVLEHWRGAAMRPTYLAAGPVVLTVPMGDPPYDIMDRPYPGDAYCVAGACVEVPRRERRLALVPVWR